MKETINTINKPSSLYFISLHKRLYNQQLTEMNFEDELLTMIPRLKNFAFRLTKNIENSEDLLSETILLALKNKAKYTDGTNFKGWVNTIMKNSFISDYRRSIKFRCTEQIEDIKSDSVCRETEIYNKLFLNEVFELINKQNEKLSIPMILFSQGFKYDEISEMIGCPIGTVKSRIFVMREKLTQIL